MLRRAFRIYVSFWPWLLFMIPLQLVVRNRPVESYNWLGSYTLLPVGEGQLILPVSWTLTYELTFYLVFAVLLVLPRQVALASILVWGMLTLVVGGAWGVSMSPYVAEFALGVGLAATVGKVAKLNPAIWAISAVIAAGAAVLSISNDDVTVRVLTGGPLGLALVGLAISAESRGFVAGKTMVSLGAASYALYLCHQPVFAFMGQWWRAVKAYPDLMWSLMIGLSVLVSLLWYFAVERWSIEAVGRMSDQVTEAVRLAAGRVGSFVSGSAHSK